MPRSINVDGELEIVLKDGTAISINDTFVHMAKVEIRNGGASVEVTAWKEGDNILSVKINAPSAKFVTRRGVG